jgi:hypothetical protein
MKKYKYKFTPLMLSLLIGLIVLALVCIAINVYSIVKNISLNIALSLTNYISYAITILLSICAVVISICAIFNSYYKITDTEIVLKWGIIKNKFDLSTIKQIKLIPLAKKMELVFKDDSFFVVSTCEKWHEEFVDELKSKNPNVSFVQDSVEGGKKG